MVVAQFCQDCETAEAVVTCPDCEMIYCSECSRRIHAKGALARHDFRPIDDSESGGGSSIELEESMGPSTMAAADRGKTAPHA